MSIKNFLAYTNPIVIIGGLPILVGIILAAAFDGIFKKTVRVVKEVNKDMEL